MSRQKAILEFTNFLIKESRKNYVNYSIKKNKENTELTYENFLNKKISIFTSAKNIQINFSKDKINEYPITKEGIINAKRDLVNNIA